MGVAAPDTGTVYVSDSNNHRIFKITNNGATVTLYATAGLPATNLDPYYWYKPEACSFVTVAGSGLAIGDAFVADTGNNRVVKIPANNGARVKYGPTTVSSLAYSPIDIVYSKTGGSIYIIDGLNNRLI